MTPEPAIPTREGRSGLTLRCLTLQMALSTTSKVRLRMPIGGAGGGPLEVVLTQQDLERLSLALFRRARLPIDQACWQVSSKNPHASSLYGACI